MTFERTSEVYGDETSIYEFNNSNNLTFEEFISMYAKDNFGSVSIQDSVLSEPEVVVEVSSKGVAEILNHNYYSFYKDLIVDDNIARGGWGVMDITIFKFKGS